MLAKRVTRLLVVLLTTLVWSLSLFAVAGAEEPGLVAETVNDAVVATQAQGVVAPRVATQPLGSVLHDNGPFVTNVGGGPGGTDLSVLQNTSLLMTIFGFGNNNGANIRMADNFTVTSPGGWSVDSMVFYNYQTGSTTTSTMTGVVVRIWDGPPNAGGAVVFGDVTTNRMVSSTWTNAYRVAENAQTGTTRPIMANTVTVGTVLPPGDYWVEWGTTGSLASGPWAVPVTIIGQTVTGDALQFNATWAAALDGTFPQGVAFQVHGTAIGGGATIAVSPSAMTASQAADTTTNQTLTISNTGASTLTWTIVEETALRTRTTEELGTAGGCTAAPIPWASVSPGSGSTGAGASTDVTVSFDSTGLATGTYTGTLCIDSNDTTTPQLRVPLTLNVGGGPSITIAQTVGTSSASCAATDVITVTTGTTVYYCYEITNTGGVTLTRHDLDDSELGTILADFPFTLLPSATAFITASNTITTTTVSTSTWTAYNPGPTDVATATDSTTVIVQVVTAVTMAGLNATGTSGVPLVGWLLAGLVALGAGLTVAYRRRS